MQQFARYRFDAVLRYSAETVEPRYGFKSRYRFKLLQLDASPAKSLRGIRIAAATKPVLCCIHVCCGIFK